MRCPGQDTRYWRPGDIFEVNCPVCGAALEFFKDESARLCHYCHSAVRNPKLELGCSEWCEHAAQCLGPDLAKRNADPSSAT